MQKKATNTKPKTIVVTGVSGFIGGTIAKYLAKRNKVIGIYRKNYPTGLKRTENLSLLKDDLVQPRNLPNICDFLIHTAADTPGNEKDDSNIWSSNEKGMINLLKWCTKTKVKKILNFSTMAVYGNNSEEHIQEETRPKNNDAYGASKLSAEQHLQHWSEKEENCMCLTIRLPGVVGIGAKETFIPRSVKKIQGKENITIFSKDNLFNNIVHVNTLAKYAETCTDETNTELKYDYFNVGASEPLRLEIVAKTLMETLGKNVLIEETSRGRKPFTIDINKSIKKKFPINTTRKTLILYATELVEKQKVNEE